MRNTNPDVVSAGKIVVV